MRINAYVPVLMYKMKSQKQNVMYLGISTTFAEVRRTLDQRRATAFLIQIKKCRIVLLLCFCFFRHQSIQHFDFNDYNDRIVTRSHFFIIFDNISIKTKKKLNGFTVIIVCNTLTSKCV